MNPATARCHQEQAEALDDFLNPPSLNFAAIMPLMGWVDWGVECLLIQEELHHGNENSQEVGSRA